MKNSKSLSCFLVILILLGSQILIAQATYPNPTPKDPVTWFSWLNQEIPDWRQGGLLLLLGFVGSLVTLFGFIGGSFPGIAGQAKIDKDETRLEILSKKLEQLIISSAESPLSGNSDVIKAVQETVNNLRDDLGKERWRQFFIASLLYSFLGAMFATMLADDFLEAIVIGAGWTALIGSLGLKKDYAERKAIKDESAKESQEVIKELVQELSAAGRPNRGAEQPVAITSRNSSINLSSILDVSGIDPKIQKWISEVNNKAIVANRL